MSPLLYFLSLSNECGGPTNFFQKTFVSVPLSLPHRAHIQLSLVHPQIAEPIKMSETEETNAQSLSALDENIEKKGKHR